MSLNGDNKMKHCHMIHSVRRISLVHLDSRSVGHSVGCSSLPRIFVVNARSLAKNNAVQLLHTDLTALDIDIAAITETWLHKVHSDSSVAINGYALFRLDRVGRKGGGVCVYVCGGLHAACLHTAKHKFGVINKHELLWVTFIKSCVKFHPPRAQYDFNELIDRLHCDIEDLVSLHPGSW